MSEELRFGVRLEDHMSGPAHTAAKSLGELGAHSEHDKSAISELAHEFTKVVEPTEVMREAFAKVGEGLREFGEGAKSGEAKEVIAGLTTTLAGLASMLDLVYPGLGQLASALIKVQGAAIGLAVGLAQSGAELAIEATLAKRSMIDMFGALAGGEEQGRATEEMLSDMSRQLGKTKDELAPFVAKFMALGVEGEEALHTMTLAAVSAQAIMRDPGAAVAFENLAKKIQLAAQTSQGLKIPLKGLGSLAEMGIRVDDVAKRMNMSTHDLAEQLKKGTADAGAFGDALQDALIEKGAAPVARMGLSMKSLGKMMSQSIDDAFEDMDQAIEPFLVQLKDMLSVMSANEAGGIALKATMGGAFKYIFSIATEALPKIEEYFLRLAIASVQAYIVVKQNWTEIRGALEPVVLFAKMIAWQMQQAADGLTRFGNALEKVSGFASRTFGGVGHEAGGQFIKGMSQGITDGIPEVQKAAGAGAVAAKVSTETKLEIHSPSRVGFRLGRQYPAGIAMGMHAGERDVERAGERIGVASVRGSVEASPGSSGRGAGVTIHGGVRIEIAAKDGVTHALELTETAVASLFERLRLAQGA